MSMTVPPFHERVRSMLDRITRSCFLTSFRLTVYILELLRQAALVQRTILGNNRDWTTAIAAAATTVLLGVEDVGLREDAEDRLLVVDVNEHEVVVGGVQLNGLHFFETGLDLGRELLFLELGK